MFHRFFSRKKNAPRVRGRFVRAKDSSSALIPDRRSNNCRTIPRYVIHKLDCVRLCNKLYSFGLFQTTRMLRGITSWKLARARVRTFMMPSYVYPFADAISAQVPHGVM